MCFLALHFEVQELISGFEIYLESASKASVITSSVNSRWSPKMSWELCRTLFRVSTGLLVAGA
eukprot:2266677-Rhodomonas_salina.4